MLFLLPEEPAPEAGPTESRWSAWGSRVLFWGAAALLAVGAVVLLVTLLGRDDTEGALPAQPTFTEEERSTSEIDPAARKVAGEFILTAVARKNVGKSWTLVHPDMRAGYTRAQWARGEIPVIPYEVNSIEEARFRVDHLGKDLIQLDVALLPRNSNDTAGVFKIGLVAVGTGENRHWVVEYWGPAGAPGFRAPPR